MLLNANVPPLYVHVPEPVAQPPAFSWNVPSTVTLPLAVSVALAAKVPPLLMDNVPVVSGLVKVIV